MYASKHNNFTYEVIFREKDPISSIMDAKDLFKCIPTTDTPFRYDLKVLIEPLCTVFKTGESFQHHQPV